MLLNSKLRCFCRASPAPHFSAEAAFLQLMKFKALTEMACLMGTARPGLSGAPAEDNDVGDALLRTAGERC